MARSNKSYRARPNTDLSDKQAVVLGREFDGILAEGVQLTPKVVVERASDTKSPLHRFFDWDDASAASKQRLDRARWLIGAVVEINVETTEPVRRYQSVRVEPERSNNLSYKRRDMLSEREGDQVKEALFRRLLSIVREAEALDLGGHWSTVIRATHAMRASRQRKSA